MAEGTLGWLLSVLALLPFVASAEQDCGPHELTRCARPLQALSDSTDIHFVSNKEEIDILCPDLDKGLQCIHSYTRRCMDSQLRAQFKKLYKGTGETVRDLCTPGPYQTEFLQHAPCLKDIRPHYERCAADHMATVGELSANNLQKDAATAGTFCCSFMGYLSCSERAVRDKCGANTADFTRHFLYRISDALLTSHCSEYFESPNKCKSQFYGYNKSHGLAPALATLLLPVVLSLAVLLSAPTNSSGIVTY